MAEPAGAIDGEEGKRNWPGGLVWAHVDPTDRASNRAAIDGRKNGQKAMLGLVIVGKATGSNTLLTQVLVARNIGFQGFQRVRSDA